MILIIFGVLRQNSCISYSKIRKSVGYALSVKLFLFCYSFGQSCIFLIGGPTKETEPTPLFLHSGDICLMTRRARLSFHAVPRILPGYADELRHCFYGDDDADKLDDDNVDIETTEIDTNHGVSAEDDPYNAKLDNKKVFIENDVNGEFANEPEIVTATVGGNKCSVENLSELMDEVVAETDWTTFQKYLNISRVNVNVRQVLKSGLELGKCPDVIKPCQKHCDK